MTRVLVAASAGVCSIPRIRGVLSVSLPSENVEVFQFGQNNALSRCLIELGYASIDLGGSAKTRRIEIRRALAKVDHLLFIWDGRTLSELLFEARLHGVPTKVHPIEVAEVVNKDRGDDFDVYIGRGTPWGNPFPVGKLEGQHERDESIARYREHFESNLLADPGMRRGLLGLRGLRLACHCKPLSCHGDVIAEFLNALDPDSVP